MAIALASRQGDVLVEGVQRKVDGEELAFAGEPPKAVEAVSAARKCVYFFYTYLFSEVCVGCWCISPSVFFALRTAG